MSAEGLAERGGSFTLKIQKNSPQNNEKSPEREWLKLESNK